MNTNIIDRHQAAIDSLQEMLDEQRKLVAKRQQAYREAVAAQTYCCNADDLLKLDRLQTRRARAFATAAKDEADLIIALAKATEAKAAAK